MTRKLRRSGDSARPAYAAQVLCGPVLTTEGIHYGRGLLLPWDAVTAAFAAEVGEPQGVRTIVFDLIAVEPDPSRLRRGWRIDAEPGEDAIEAARRIEAGLARSAGEASASIKSLATDGIPSRWYPDLLAYEDALVAQLRG